MSGTGPRRRSHDVHAVSRKTTVRPALASGVSTPGYCRRLREGRFRYARLPHCNVFRTMHDQFVVGFLHQRAHGAYSCFDDHIYLIDVLSDNYYMVSGGSRAPGLASIRRI